jgi:hypothetical protein
LTRWLFATLLFAACAEAPAGTFFEGLDSAIEPPPLDPDAGMPNVGEPGEPGEPGAGGTTGGIPPFPIPMQDAAVPPVMMDASRPPQATDAGRDTSTPPPPPMDAARPPVVQDAAPDVVAPRPDTGTPPATGATCATTPAYATPDACSKCICMNCGSQVAACYASDDPAKNQSCKSVRDCAQANRCTSEACYCGSSPTCLFPDGPCMSVIQTAAGATDALGVQAARDDPESPVYRSNQVGTCQMANCASECGL